MAGKRISRQKLNIVINTLPLPVQEHSARCKLIAAYLVEKINTEDWFFDDKLNGESIVAAVYYHDIGKATLPTDAIYPDTDKAGNKLYLEHVPSGIDVVNNVCDIDIGNYGDRSLETYILRAISHHHERYDGKGYPLKLKGNAISVTGRITAVVDAVDNIFFVGATESRDFDSCVSQLVSMAGKALDPYFVNVLTDDRQTFRGFIEYIDNKNRNKRKNDSYGLQFYFKPVQNIRENQSFAWISEYVINDPYYGMLRPEIFLPVADTSAQMTKLSKLALERVLLMLDYIAEKSDKSPRVSIKMATRALSSKNYVSELIKLLDKYNVKKNAVCLVFDESGLTDEDVDYASKFTELQDGGYRIAIDCMGDGASMLTQLDRLPVDYLFINGTFTNRIALNPNTYGMASGVLDIAHNLHMSVVFQGVDGRRVEGELLKMRALYGCGELYGAALPQKEFISFIINEGGDSR